MQIAAKKTATFILTSSHAIYVGVIVYFNIYKMAFYFQYATNVIPSIDRQWLFSEYNGRNVCKRVTLIAIYPRILPHCRIT